jgi:GcvH upstream region-like protein
MLGFLRRHQKYFWIMITVVIVISFSFFGTYSTMQERTVVDPVVFNTINGTSVHQSELEEMVKFLATDNEDKEWMGGAWGPNFLNDGVIKNNFIETGLAEVLVVSYLQDMKKDLDARLQKEKRYQPYENSQAKFISVSNSWKYFAPNMEKNLQQLQSIEDAATLDAFQIRLNLFQSQRKFPPYALRQALRYQEQQFKWVAPDPALQRLDLAMFGYHTVEDWFGPHFVRLVTSFIINSSIIAEQRGYAVTREEAYADLVKNAEMSFQTLKNSPNLGVATSSEYFTEQLRRMGMDLGSAVMIWQKVMQFRRLFNEQSNVVFLDPYSINLLNEYAQETIEGELYGLPDELKMNDFKTLQQFETYLGAVAKTTPNSLELPKTFLSPEEVSKLFPELVQKRYLLEIAGVNKKTLQGKVSLRETWNWESEEANWNKLKKEFPDIGVKNGANPEERLAALDGLDNKTRARVDAFARDAIIEAHPEWVQEALETGPMKKMEIGIRLKGKSILPGLKEPKDLISLLDAWPESKGKLATFSPDKNNYYKIQVVEKTPGLEVLTFAEAKNDGTMDALLQSQPKKDYTKLLESIRLDYVKANPEDKSADKMVEDYAATLRFYSNVRDLKTKISKSPESESQYVKEESIKDNQTSESLTKRPELSDQWKLVKSKYSADRSKENGYFEVSEVLSTPVNGLSKIYTRRNGEVVFFRMLQLGNNPHNEELYQNVYQVQKLLGVEAEAVLMRNLLVDFENKNAMYIQL